MYSSKGQREGCWDDQCARQVGDNLYLHSPWCQADLIEDAAALRKRLAAALEMLWKIAEGSERCPICWAWVYHKEDCELDALVNPKEQR